MLGVIVLHLCFEHQVEIARRGERPRCACHTVPLSLAAQRRHLDFMYPQYHSPQTCGNISFPTLCCLTRLWRGDTCLFLLRRIGVSPQLSQSKLTYQYVLRVWCQ